MPDVTSAGNVSTLGLIVVALIGAVPATIAAVASWRRVAETREARDETRLAREELTRHADDDAAFQTWIVGKLDRLFPYDDEAGSS